MVGITQALPLSPRQRKEAKRFIKFATVGVAGMIAHLTIFNILLVVFRVPAIIANPIGFSWAVVQNFLLNRRWTFPESQARAIGKQLGQFALISIIGLGINLAIQWIVAKLADPIVASMVHDEHLAHVITENVGVIFAIGVVLFWNFGANRLWTFRSKAAAPAGTLS